MERAAQPTDDPLDRLFKLLPAESAGAFLVVRTAFPSETSDSAQFFALVGAIIFLTPILLWIVWDVKDKFQISFITVSLIIWIANIEIDRLQSVSQDLSPAFRDWVFNPLIIKGTLIIWAIMLIPLVFRKKTAEGGGNDQP